jgi:hypothetical protein
MEVETPKSYLDYNDFAKFYGLWCIEVKMLDSIEDLNKQITKIDNMCQSAIPEEFRDKVSEFIEAAKSIQENILILKEWGVEVK